MNIEIRLHGKKGGYVDVYLKTDANKKDQHIEIAKILADKGNQIALLPEINIKDKEQRKLIFPELAFTNASNPDARINGLLADFKVPDSNPVGERAIANALKATNKKEVELCVFSVVGKVYSLKKILSSIQGSFKNNNYPYVKEVWLVLNDKSILKIPRGLTQHKNYYKIAKAL